MMLIPELTNQAWEKILVLNPSNEDLLEIFEFEYDSLKSFRKLVADKIIQQKPNNHDLQKIIEGVPELRHQAAETLLSNYKGDKKDLYCVITKLESTEESYFKGMAAEMLFKHKKADDDDFFVIVKHCQGGFGAATNAAEKILKGKDECSLAFLIKKYPQFKKQAAEKLLKIKACPSCLVKILLDEDLEFFWNETSRQILSKSGFDESCRSALKLIVEKVPELREESVERLLKGYSGGQCGDEDIDFLIRFSIKFKKEAEDLKKARIREQLLFEIRIFSARN